MTEAVLNPSLEAIWQATPTAKRYQMNGSRHIEITVDRHFMLVSLTGLTPTQIAALGRRPC